jgi:hypothetical protein
MPACVTRPSVFADNLSRQTLPGYITIAFPQVDGMEQEEKEDAVLFQPDSDPLPCSHEVQNALNVRFPTPWVAIGGPKPWLSLDLFLSPKDW